MRYRKKPVVIEAVQWTGKNMVEVATFCPVAKRAGLTLHLDIRTREGTMRANCNDWIIKGVAGEFYPCKPDIFAASYDPAGSGDERKSK